MSNFECGKCGGRLKRTDETIETVDPLSNYEMKKAGVLVCRNCNERFYITLESESHD